MKILSRFVIALSLIVGTPSYAWTATYCDFNIRSDCPTPVAGADFPAAEMKAACLKDMSALANEPDELKQAVLSSCIAYARARFEMVHQPSSSISYWHELDAQCRGGSGDDADSIRACDKRLAVDKILKTRGCAFRYPNGWPGLKGEYWKCPK